MKDHPTPTAPRRRRLLGALALPILGAACFGLAACDPLPPPCDGQVPTIAGTAGPDILYGTPGNDVIVGLGGDDTIVGYGGADRICGNDGLDVLLGETQTATSGSGDKIWGGADKDNLLGGPGDDQLFGEGGEDFVHGEAGADFVIGGPDRDVVAGGAGPDVHAGEAGNDIVNAIYNDDGSQDHALGGTGKDVLHTNDGVTNDILDGGADPYKDICYTDTFESIVVNCTYPSP